MPAIIIRNARVVNEGKIFSSDVLIEAGLISKVDKNISSNKNYVEINAEGLHLFPGVIDDQVHFREPGLTHKGDIYTESKAAVAGGITSYMEMPNTIPNTLTQELLEEKYQIGSKNSLANYSFYMGASNDNLDEVLKTNPGNVCGIKIFMGSSTGNMLVDNEKSLENIFSKCNILIATHCEDEATIRKNFEDYKSEFGDDIPVKFHPLIRSEDACFKSSSHAVALAKKFNARLHVLHISTEKEISLFDAQTPLAEKRITAEACMHHLWFCDEDYTRLGNFIKWNPAIKTSKDRAAIFKAVLDNYIDVIATDHAPHTVEEKKQIYTKAPSGGPLVQHSLIAMLQFYFEKKISLEKIVEKMCHAPSVCFHIEKRGYLREGYHADLVLANLKHPWKVDKSNILSKCGWSPFEGNEFHAKVTHTFVNGNLVYENGIFFEEVKGHRLLFNRN
ncbi:MAG: dihydroorotase [Bacteroidia bacterium]